jgi:hypothetical protein
MSIGLAPRGKESNLLAGSCRPEKLKQALIPQDKYHPFPTIHRLPMVAKIDAGCEPTASPGGLLKPAARNLRDKE